MKPTPAWLVKEIAPEPADALWATSGYSEGGLFDLLCCAAGMDEHDLPDGQLEPIIRLARKLLLAGMRARQSPGRPPKLSDDELSKIEAALARRKGRRGKASQKQVLASVFVDIGKDVSADRTMRRIRRRAKGA